MSNVPLYHQPRPTRQRTDAFTAHVKSIRFSGQPTLRSSTEIHLETGATVSVPTFVNEFWTAKQRQGHSLHEISYRACFKPELAAFFINRLSAVGEVVYDPFMGRGTTLLEGALLGRVPYGCDINPLSVVLLKPRLAPPSLDSLATRLREIDFQRRSEQPEDLLVFFHPETLHEIGALKEYLRDRKAARLDDPLDHWIEMVAINRLTGHSPGFFSVYTLPPNQAVSVQSQRKINSDRNQIPTRRDVPLLILKKSKQLLRDCDAAARQTLSTVSNRALLLTSACWDTSQIPSGSVSLVVTSPPFLDIVDYATDNWMRCWFLGMDSKSIEITVPKKISDWRISMTRVFAELARVLKPGGHIAFEVGEVMRGKVKLEETVVPCGLAAGLTAEFIMINAQKFTKTANCWGVDNNVKGTNSNRIVLFSKI